LAKLVTSVGLSGLSRRTRKVFSRKAIVPGSSVKIKVFDVMVHLETVVCVPPRT